jgi:subtilisin family serine protease
MKRKLLVMVGILCLVAPAWAADGPPLGKGKLGFGFAPGLVAGKDFVAGQLIVGMQEGAVIQAVRSAAVGQRAQVAKEIPGQALLLQFDTEAAAVAAVHQLLATPGVAFVERNGFLRIPPQPQLPADLKGQSAGPKGQKGGADSSGDIKAATVSADIATGLQAHLTIIRKTAALPALVAAPPTVAVIDTGVDYTHSDLAGKVFLGLNAIANTFDPMDDNGHGTHCAGVIGAIAGNNRFGEGVCPNCKILAIKVLDESGSGSFFDVAVGMAYAIANRNATAPPTRVVSMSLGGPASALVAAQVLAMRNAGMALAAAAGNENSSTVPSFPGADTNTALRVMATTGNDSRAWFSNFSPAATPGRYNIAAPGWNIWSTVPGEGFAQMSGTSMATPMVAGSAALVWGQLPALTRDQLVARLLTNGKSISKGFAAATRRVDVRKAILAASVTALVGELIDPFTGYPHSPNTTPDTASLWTTAVPPAQVAADATNRSGMYEMTGLAAGARTIRAARAALGGTPAFPVRDMRRVTIVANLVTGPFTDAKPRARAAGNASVTFDWYTTQPIVGVAGCLHASTCNGWDFDLYVKLPSNQYIGFGNEGDLMASPFVTWPRDSADDLVPAETLVIGSSAANGVYKVFAEKFPYANNFNPSWTGSLASAQVYNGTTLIANYQPFGAPAPAACGATRFWYIGDLTKNGNVYAWTNRNLCQAAAP